MAALTCCRSDIGHMNLDLGPLSHVVGLTSAWNQHGVAVGLDVLLVAVGRQGHSVLTGMKLAVDLGAGPRQHLAATQETMVTPEAG